MGVASVGAATAAPSWRLIPAVAADTQGLVVSPFAHLPEAQALFLDAGGAAPGWLAALRQVAPITSAAGRVEGRCAALAFTCSGLRALGVDDTTLGTFTVAFREGMHEQERRRRLGDDVPAGEPGSTLVPDGPRWSGNNPAAGIGTPLTVHALLLLYATDQAALNEWAAAVQAALAPFGVRAACDLPLSLRFDDRGVAREHFGFADGISQPIPHDTPVVVRNDPGAVEPDPWHGIPLGEVLCGYANAHGEPAPGPRTPDPAALGGERDIGTNGSYLVVRELHQDVAAFWRSMEAMAAALGDPLKDGRWAAERVVGRAMDGHMLLPEGLLRAPTPYAPNGPDNAFGFFDADRHGFGCPIGSHVRRSNPRDGLAPLAADAPGLLSAANNHRLLRRGRKFGPDFPASGQEDPASGAARGLLFMALNTDLTRQFEFVQQSWVLNRAFATLMEETDPLVGPAGPFTVPECPLRWRLPVESFIRFAGGEYFFLPSLAALDWLDALRRSAAADDAHR